MQLHFAIALVYYRSRSVWQSSLLLPLCSGPTSYSSAVSSGSRRRLFLKAATSTLSRGAPARRLKNLNIRARGRGRRLKNLNLSMYTQINKRIWIDLQFSYDVQEIRL